MLQALMLHIAEIVQGWVRNMFNLRSVAWFSCGIWLMLASFSACAEAPTTADFKGPGTLVLGKISDNPKAHFVGLRPLLDYVVERMSDLGVTEGKIIISRDRRQGCLGRPIEDSMTDRAGRR